MSENYKALKVDNEEMVNRLEQVFGELPLAYKRFVTFWDWLLVMKGIKAATDFVLLGDVDDEKEFEILKEVFDKVGLQFSKTSIRRGKEDELSRYGFIYNSGALKEQTANSKMVPPYNGEMDVYDYVNGAITQGYSKFTLLGKIYSFPESAIQDFSRRGQLARICHFLERVRMLNRNLIQSVGETYWFYGKPNQDVVDREREKDIFFRFFLENSRFQAILQSDDLRKSNEEWSRRLVEDVERARERMVKL